MCFQLCSNVFVVQMSMVSRISLKLVLYLTQPAIASLPLGTKRCPGLTLYISYAKPEVAHLFLQRVLIHFSDKYYSKIIIWSLWWFLPLDFSINMNYDVINLYNRLDYFYLTFMSLCLYPSLCFTQWQSWYPLIAELIHNPIQHLSQGGLGTPWGSWELWLMYLLF